MSIPAGGPPTEVFARSRDRFDGMLTFLEGEEASVLTHAELEARMQIQGRELIRHLFQDHLDLRADRETRLESVADADGKPHRIVEAGHVRTLTTVFGDVTVRRHTYRTREAANLYPADASLNLPEERHSHGLRRLAAIEAARGSYDSTLQAIERATGQHLGKRQVEGLARRAGGDFDAFYAARPQPGDCDDVLVISCDGKGIVMRPEALREATAKAAASSTTKLATRLSKGEKRNRKRMAEVGSVYDIIPTPRTSADILTDANHQPAHTTPAPAAHNKWLTASVVDDAATVVGQIFDEADRRDPKHKRTWIALVDGNNHQIDRIKAEAKTRSVNVSIIIDFIHVLEYLWKAAWCFHDEGDPDAETWVRDKALAVLDGHSSRVAAAIRRKATRRHLDRATRAGADTCADYLLRKRPYLNYPIALTAGWPIATGVIEGACRHLVKDRMDLTGARWGLQGAEAILKLRAINSNGDFDDYWRYHLKQERRRIHETRYANNVIPQAA